MTSIRPSFAERDAFRSALSQAYADGRIDDADFERRSTLVETGRGADDLRRALQDLPQPELEFPTTVTRAEAAGRLRRSRGATSPTVARRALLAAGAGLLGFAVAGGFGQLANTVFGSGAAGGSDSEQPDAGKRDFLNDASATQTVLDEVTKEGYDSFQTVSLYPHMFTATAQSLRSSRGVDSITVYDDGETKIEPATHLSVDAKLFELGDIAFERIPAMAAAAVDTIGAKTASYANVSIAEDGPTITIYVEGDDYGVGSGYMEWSPDGRELLRIHRDDED